MLLNLTGHDVNILSGYGAVLIAPSGPSVRVQTEYREVATIDDSIPMLEVYNQHVTDRPEPRANTFIIVSNYVLTACPDRNDLLSPKELIKDRTGRTIGCRGLGR